jgi:diguanylate cyclase (GGDEF)-like protein/PAS domain S-box-containing protein
MRATAAWDGRGKPEAHPLLQAYELDQLPCIALVECGGEVVARNQLYWELTGDARVGAAAVDSLLLGAFPKTSMSGEGGRQRFECLMVRQSGRPMVVSGSARPVIYANRSARLILLMERSEGAAFADAGQSMLLEGLLNSVSEAVAVVYEGRILHVNREFTRLFGYSAEECIGSSLDELILPRGEVGEPEQRGGAALETRRRTRSGEEIDVAVRSLPLALCGGVMGRCVTLRDIRQQKLANAKLQHSALHDGLTGLANRALFLDRLRQTMARGERRPGSGYSVMFLDVDHFKQVNDSLGHAVGDALLQEVASRLVGCLRPEDTVSRFGGDEFALLVGDAAVDHDVARVAERIQTAICEPVWVGQEEVLVSASIGIANGGAHYQMPEEILRDADYAMYRAKANGKRRHEFFDPALPVLLPGKKRMGSGALMGGARGDFVA